MNRLSLTIQGPTQERGHGLVTFHIGAEAVERLPDQVEYEQFRRVVTALLNNDAAGMKEALETPSPIEVADSAEVAKALAKARAQP